MSPRIPPAPRPYSEAIQRRLEKIMGPGKEPLVLFTTLARDERLFERFTGGGLLDRGHLTLRQREIVIDRVTASCGRLLFNQFAAASARTLGGAIFRRRSASDAIAKRALSPRGKYTHRGARRRASAESSLCSDPFFSRRNHGDSFSRASAALA
jgi:hypothetical protein